MNVPKSKDGSVHFGNSEVKGLKLPLVHVHFKIQTCMLLSCWVCDVVGCLYGSNSVSFRLHENLSSENWLEIARLHTVTKIPKHDTHLFCKIDGNLINAICFNLLLIKIKVFSLEIGICSKSRRWEHFLDTSSGFNPARIRSALMLAS